MRTTMLLVLGTAAVLLAGCDKSKPAPTEGEQPESAAMPQTQIAITAATEETKKAVAEAASSVVETAKTQASSIGEKFLATAKVQSDSVLKSIGEDLAAKAQALVTSCSGNGAVKTNVETSLASLANGKDSEALAPAFEVSKGVGLTDQQVKLAKEVGNLASAFVVQRNFSSLSGAQGDVATLVNSLRNGQYASTLAPLKNIMNNASLTPPQQQLIGSIADQYAPALKGTATTLQQGLRTLQGLPGTK